MFLEVKPEAPSEDEVKKAVRLAEEHPCGHVLVVSGTPICSSQRSYAARLFQRINSRVFIRQDERFMQCLVCGRVLFGCFWDGGCGGRYYCEACDVWDRTSPERCELVGCRFSKGDIDTNGQSPLLTPTMVAAYAAARSERFGT
jgi:hypothetical protein